MFSTLFGSPKYYFTRPMLERNGYMISSKDGKAIVTINALGISPEDIKVEMYESYGEDYLKVYGETTVNESNFSVNLAFPVRNKIKEVTYSMENGLLFLEVEFDKPTSDVRIVRK